LRRIDGRAIDSVVLPSGRRVFWPFFHEALGALPGVREWRVLARPGTPLRVQIAAEPAVVPVVHRALAAAAPEAEDWVVEALAEIPRRPGEKPRLVVTSP
jgi:hypothetical protein